MPQRKTKIKSMHLNKIRQRRNRQIKDELKKTVKKYLELISAKKLEEAKTKFKEVASKLDKAEKKNLIHKNTASRRKSRLSVKSKA
ncbi:MAG: 30S ribosomal protein S20 [Candidatus Omnitrophota bacterium]